MIKKNILANLVGRFWSVLSVFFFLPIYIKFLGIENFSIISFSLIIHGLMIVIDSGLSAALAREFARSDNSNETKIKLFKTLESLYLIIIFICIIVMFGLSNIIANNWLNLNSLTPVKVSFFIKIFSFDIGFQLLLRLYFGGLLGLEQQVKSNFYQIGWGIFRNGLVIFILYLSPTLMAFFIWQAISTLIFVIIVRISLNKVLTGKYEFNFPSKVEFTLLKSIRNFAGGMTLISLIAALNTQADKLMISKLLPIESLGYYTLAVSLSMGIIVLVNPISIALLPRFTALYSSNNMKKASMLFHEFFLTSVILSFSAFSILFFFSKEILILWTGDINLANQAYKFLPVLGFTGAMLSISLLPYNIATANGYTKIFNLFGIISLFITIPCYWFAIKLFGAIGPAYVYCVIQSIAVLIYIKVVNDKFLKKITTLKIYVYDLLFPLIISFLIAFLFSFIPSCAVHNKLLLTGWIGLAAISTFSFSILILMPLNDIKKKYLNDKLINYFKLK